MKFLNKTSLTIALIFLFQTSAQGVEKWSKQVISNEPPTAEDWVPIRQGKMISFERDLTPAAQQQFQFFAEPLNNRYSHLGQPQQHSASPSEINNFAIPSNNPPPFQFFNSLPQSPAKTRTIQNFGGQLKGPQAEALIQNPPPPPHFQYMQEIRNGPNVVHYQSQPIPKSLSGFPSSQNLNNFPSRTSQFQKLPPPQFQPIQGPPPQFQPIPNEQSNAQSSNNGQDPVQLLYVPFDSLYPQNEQQQQQRPSGDSRFNVLNQPVSAALINDFYSQNEVQEIQSKPPTTRRPTVAPVTSSLKPTNPFESHLKPKPHQPPLSMFVRVENGQASESDVLKTLQSSNTIDVMDTYSSNSPNVFIGPSGMVAPEGYRKFELPYLSNIENTRSERKIEQLPFFVAPLSYKTPPGFSKIPLPAPHVGSVVVNQPNSLEGEVTGFTRDNYFTKKPSASPTTAQHFSSIADNKQKVVSLNSGFKLSSDGNVEVIRNEFTFPTLQPSRPSPTFEAQRSVFTTPRSTFAASTAETPLTKVAYKEIEEKRNYGHSSTLVNPSTTRAPVTSRTKSENYYASSPRSTARQPTTKTTQQSPTINEDYFSYDNSKRPIAQFSFGTEVENPTHHFDFRPIPNNFNFGEVDFATTKRPTKAKASTASTSKFNFPSSTPIPSPSFSFSPTVSVIENTDAFGHVNGGSDGNFFEFKSTNRPSQENFSNANRFNFGTEQTYTPAQQYTNDNSNENTADDSVVTTENPNYSLPSDLPEISPQLPVQVPTTTTTTTTTTRRPNRGSRRPVSRVTAQAQQQSDTSTADRRPSTTSRRSRPTTAFPSRSSASPTETSAIPSRSTVSRGSKVRYNATSDEKSRFRTRGRGGNSKGTEEDNIEYQRDVLNQNYPSSIRPLAAAEYVTTTERLIEINNNENNVYKFESAEVAAESPSVNDYNTPIENVEVIPLGGNENSFKDNNTPDSHSSASPLYYENTIDITTTTSTQPPPLPSNHKYFNDIEQPATAVKKLHKNVATANRLRGNFNYNNNKNRNIDSFYNTRDSTTTQQTEFEDDEILITVPTTQAPTTTTTTTQQPTTEAITESPTTRRTNFRRRTFTTTEATPQSEDGTTRSRNGANGRKENVVVVKRVRGRARASTTTTEQPERSEPTRRSPAIRTRAPYTRTSNRETTRERGSDNASNEENKPRFRIRENTGRFRLDTQESQWSSRFNQNSFQPVNEKGKEIEIDDEQEIVTANPNVDEEDVYLVNVTASVVPKDETQKVKKEDETSGDFDKFVENIMKDIESEPKVETKTEKKSVGTDKKAARRGVWKRVKVRPNDGLEAAETQNIGKQLANSVQENDKVEGVKRATTTVKPDEETTQIVITTTDATVDESKGMFDEARKALTALFSSEADTEDGLNMEEVDEKLEEALQESSTTTQIPITTEDPTTTIQPTTAEVATQKPQKKTVSSSKKVQTSTSQKVTGEICYRGRCIKTDEK